MNLYEASKTATTLPFGMGHTSIPYRIEDITERSVSVVAGGITERTIRGLAAGSVAWVFDRILDENP